MRQEPIDVQIRALWHSFAAAPKAAAAAQSAAAQSATAQSAAAPTAATLLALRDVNMSVAPGEFVSLVGVSGCGKSTLLRLVAGLLEPTAGEVRLAGEPPQVMRAAKRISWMAQQAALLPWRTVLENVTLPLRINPQAANGGGPPRLSPAELLQLVGLSDFAQAYPQTLSGGMQQRAALARALATGASLWLMDEPFAALDELTRAMLTEELLTMWRQFQPTTIWITHNISEALRLSNRVIVMTPRPGTIAGEVQVDLPYPRDDTSMAFQGLLREVRGVLTR